MAYVIQQKVQDWLAGKLVVPAIDADIDGSIRDIAFGKLATRYVTTTWTDNTNTPALVLSAMTMLYASVIYNRAYSEDTEGTNQWADWLERMAMDILDGLAAGIITLIGIPTIDDEGLVGDPAFFPTDIQETDGLGNEIKFTMAKEF